MDKKLKKLTEEDLEKTVDFIRMPSINRVEVIDGKGRSYVSMNAKDVEISFQDDGKTMKIFLK